MLHDQESSDRGEDLDMEGGDKDVRQNHPQKNRLQESASGASLLRPGHSGIRKGDVFVQELLPHFFLSHRLDFSG